MPRSCSTLVRARVLCACDTAVNKGARSKLGCSPLWLACAYGHEQVVAELIAAKADVEASDAARVSPLQAAAVREHTHIVHQLLLAGAKNAILRTPRPFKELPRNTAKHRVHHIPQPSSFARLELRFAATRPALRAEMEGIKWRKPPVKKSSPHRTPPENPQSRAPTRSKVEGEAASLRRSAW